MPSVNSRGHACIIGQLSPASRRLFECGFVGLAFRGGHAPDEIGDSGAERELCAVRVLEPQLTISNDPAAVQDAARGPRARPQWSVDIDDRNCAIGIDIVDDQRCASIAIPRCVAPYSEKAPVRVGNIRRIGDPVAYALLAKYPAPCRPRGRRWRLSAGRDGGEHDQGRKREREAHDEAIRPDDVGNKLLPRNQPVLYRDPNAAEFC
jgi:hypothetical protein